MSIISIISFLGKKILHKEKEILMLKDNNNQVLRARCEPCAFLGAKGPFLYTVLDFRLGLVNPSEPEYYWITIVQLQKA